MDDKNIFGDIYIKDLNSGTYQLISASAAGVAGDDISYNEKWSSDGQKVIFISEATNLVPGDTNGLKDVFIKDLQTGAIERVSVSLDGTQGDGKIGKEASLSPDGTKVVFTSTATNLHPSANDGTEHVYVKDLFSEQLILVTPGSDGGSYSPLFSNDGSMLLFVSEASTLVTPDTNGGNDVFVRLAPFDGSAQLYRVSEDELGVQADIDGAFFLGSSNKVVFTSSATNLVPGDSNGSQDVFLKDIITGVVERISETALGGELATYSNILTVSSNGRYVYFYTPSDLLVAGDTNGTDDIFVKDLQTGIISRVNADGDNTLTFHNLDATGTKVLFSVILPNVDDPMKFDQLLYTTDITTGVRQLVSSSSSGEMANGNSAEAAIFSLDSSKVYFMSEASNLVPNDDNKERDYFVKTLGSGAIERILFETVGEISAGEHDTLAREGISSAAGKVAFCSEASNLVADDDKSQQDIFIHDIKTGQLTLVSRSASGVIGNGKSSQPGLSPDGKKLVFASSADNLIANGTNGVEDIFLKDITTGAITRLSQTAGGIAGDDNSIEPLFSPDGKKVYFVSDASNLVASAIKHNKNIYVKNLSTGSVELVTEQAENMKLSADGKKIVFSTWRIDTGVNPGKLSCFVKDLVTGVESRISEDLAGIGLGLDSVYPQISNDGNLVAFTHLDLDDFNNNGSFSSVKIYIKDLRTGVLSRGDLKKDGTPYDNVSSLPKFTPDGKSIVFYSAATDLGVGSKSGSQICKRHLVTGEITKLSVNTEGDESDGKGVDFPDFHVTYDGNAIVFTSDASNLVEHDQVGVKQLFVRKMTSNNSVPTFNSVPSIPVNVSATQQAGSIEVSFDPPTDDGGSAVKGYTVTSSPGGITASGGSSPILITGLTPGQSYTFTVTASNDVGESLPSDASGSVLAPTLTAPGAPVITSANQQSGSIVVYYDPPTNDGGSPITSYTVTSSPGGITTSGTGSSILMTGLTPGQSYTFTVTALNAIGESLPSDASGSVLAPLTFTAPGAPVMISASISAGQPAVVSFSAPADVGSGIISYEVLATGGATSVTTGASSPISVSALMPMSNYNFTVRACGIGGCGPYSGSSNSVFVPLPPPEKTSIGVASPAPQGADVSFTAPSGAGIVGYQVETTPGGLTTHMGATSPIRINGLTFGVSYTFRVRAFSVHGYGEFSDASNSVLPTP